MPQRIHETCTVPGCLAPHKARGYCQAHYQHFKRGVPIKAEIARRDTTEYEHCSEPGCMEPVKAKGICSMHYARKLRHGHTRYQDRKRAPKPCSVAGCESHLYAKGLCHLHYMRARKATGVYGITTKRVEEMMVEQDGKCAICGQANTTLNGLSGKVFALSIDHSHVTGAVRGLLCHEHNRALGMFGDSPDTLASAIRYLAKHSDDPSATLARVMTLLSEALPTT